MSKQDTRLVWIVPLVLALAVLACSGAQPEATATPLPRPTQKPNATETTAPATEAPVATKAPATRRAPATKVPAKASATPAEGQPTEVPTEATTGNAPFTLSSTPYTHKTGAFTITLPDGWTPQDGDNSVFASSPDNVSSIDITFTNVGPKLDADAFNTLIQAEEDNWFATYKDYQAKPNATQKDGSILVFKTFSLDDGTPETAFSYYQLNGNVVYEEDFWVNSDSYDAYSAGLVDVANSLTTNPDAGAKVDPYAVVYTFTDTNNFYQFKVPYAWTHSTSTDTNTGIETFTSPDKLSYVENIEYDNGTAVSKSDAGAFALTLLKQYYKVTDLKVTDDQPQTDGSELLVWNSASQGIDGESFFETRGTTFLLLTWVVDTNQYDFFKPVWKTLVGSYAIPQP